MTPTLYRDYVSSEFSDEEARYLLKVEEDDRTFTATARVYNPHDEGYREFVIHELQADYQDTPEPEAKAAFAFRGLIGALSQLPEADADDLAQEFYEGLMADARRWLGGLPAPLAQGAQGTIGFDLSEVDFTPPIEGTHDGSS